MFRSSVTGKHKHPLPCQPNILPPYPPVLFLRIWLSFKRRQSDFWASVFVTFLACKTFFSPGINMPAGGGSEDEQKLEPNGYDVIDPFDLSTMSPEEMECFEREMWARFLPNPSKIRRHQNLNSIAFVSLTTTFYSLYWQVNKPIRMTANPLLFRTNGRQQQSAQTVRTQLRGV